MKPNIDFWEKDAPLVIAHRGASSVAPENTLLAFKTAAAQGADGIELDVKLTRDSVLVAHHDQTLDRTTDGSGFVANWTWAELRRLDAGAHFGTEFKGNRIPRLEDIFHELGDSMIYNLELTEYRRPLTNVVNKTIALVEAIGLKSRVIFSSFSPLELMRVRRFVDPEQIALLAHARTPAFIRAIMQWITPHAIYHPSDGITTEQTIRDAHRVGKRINIWTVNNRERMRFFLDRGVDGLITDFPDTALQVRDRL